MAQRFQTTKGSVVLAARTGTAPESRAALSSLCEAYRYPLYAHVRSQGYAPDDASDLTQAYFLQLLEKKFLKDVDPAAGRFRSFLLYNLASILSDQERPVEAEPLLRRTLAIREASLGPDHRLVSDVLGTPARACRARQRRDEERALLERAVEIRSAATPDHPALPNLEASLAALDEKGD